MGEWLRANFTVAKSNTENVSQDQNHCCVNWVADHVNGTVHVAICRRCGRMPFVRYINWYSYLTTNILAGMPVPYLI